MMTSEIWAAKMGLHPQQTREAFRQFAEQRIQYSEVSEVVKLRPYRQQWCIVGWVHWLWFKCGFKAQAHSDWRYIRNAYIKGGLGYKDKWKRYWADFMASFP
uniref:Uncharacterized protein n=1 Tax=viral metagenome TaxID=1070528 RepID=A0A6M3Y1B5_9ZZZZ